MLSTVSYTHLHQGDSRRIVVYGRGCRNETISLNICGDSAELNGGVEGGSGGLWLIAGGKHPPGHGNIASIRSSGHSSMSGAYGSPRI